MLMSRPSHPDQGTYASSRTWGGMRWTRMRSPDERRDWRTAKSCGPGAPWLAPSLLMMSLQATVTRTSRTPGRARSSVNTIAQGMFWRKNAFNINGVRLLCRQLCRDPQKLLIAVKNSSAGCAFAPRSRQEPRCWQSMAVESGPQTTTSPATSID